ncbi:MAG: hypothetical protein KatS3mg047_0535 [Bellilinea sp.]|nr:MAG: hypothetical protein KatS3mg047_0535 [Bellilinea sp.]
MLRESFETLLDSKCTPSYYCFMLTKLHEIKGFFPGLTLFSLLIILLTGFYSPAESNSGSALPRIGFSAPLFSLPDGENRSISLHDYEGSVVILNFWASWCPPCRAEMPAFQEVYDFHRDDGVIILGVNTTYQDDAESARQFAIERGVQFPVLYDFDNSVSRMYQIQALPTTFFIDRRGVIRNVIYGGPLNEALLKVEVEKLLKEMP